MDILTQNTLIPVGVAIAVIGGGTAWLTRIHISVSQIKKEMTELIAWRKENEIVSSGVNGRLIKIETQLENVINLLARVLQQK